MKNNKKNFYEYKKYKNLMNAENSLEKTRYLSAFAKLCFPDIINKYKVERSRELRIRTNRRSYLVSNPKSYHAIRNNKELFEKHKERARQYRIKKRNSREANSLEAIFEKTKPNIETGMLEGKVKVYQTKDGYQFVFFMTKTFYVHRLIWMKANNQFIPEGFEINHLNFNKKDNRIVNLELLTHVKNMEHRRLNNSKIIHLRKQISKLKQLTVMQIAKKLNITKYKVRYALKGTKIKVKKSKSGRPKKGKN